MYVLCKYTETQLEDPPCKHQYIITYEWYILPIRHVQ